MRVPPTPTRPTASLRVLRAPRSGRRPGAARELSTPGPRGKGAGALVVGRGPTTGQPRLGGAAGLARVLAASVRRARPDKLQAATVEPPPGIEITHLGRAPGDHPRPLRGRLRGAPRHPRQRGRADRAVRRVALGAHAGHRRPAPRGRSSAMAGDEVVGWAKLSFWDAKPDTPFHDLTGVKRAWRGAGLREPLKHAQLNWAKDQGFRALRTAMVDREHEPIRRLNAELGYQPIPAGSSSRAYLRLIASSSARRVSTPRGGGGSRPSPSCRSADRSPRPRPPRRPRRRPSRTPPPRRSTVEASGSCSWSAIFAPPLTTAATPTVAHCLRPLVELDVRPPGLARLRDRDSG